jgi:hypothetical protein
MPDTNLIPKRGALPTPPSVLAGATPFKDRKISAPPSFLMWPVQLSSWNNYVYGDCVSAEEAFAKATAAPQTFIPEATVVAWATAHGYLNGAYLTDVMTTMQTDGFPLNNQTFNDGPHFLVDQTNAATLQSAIYSQGPVKLGVGAEYFQSNANGIVTPGTSGWAMYNYPPNQPEDHSTSLCGYGTLAELVSLFRQQGVTVNVPNGMPTGLCYAMFTWNSIGIIDEQSMLNMTYEAWVRIPTTIVAGGPQPGSMQIFARGGDGAVWHNWQTAPNNGWSGWYSLGGWVDIIEVAKNADGRTEIFARGGDGAVWHNWELAPGGGWSGWYSLGGWIDLLDIRNNADGRLEIFARGGDGAVWHNWQTAPNNGWSGWYSLGGWIDRLEVSQNADGRLEIFARGGDGAVWHNWQTAPNNGWSGWYSLGGWIDLLAVDDRNADGRLEIFARGGDGAVWHNWQTAPNNGWSGWYSLGGWIDLLDMCKNADGRLEIFARGGDGAVWHNWQTAPNNGWSGWYSLGGWIDRLEVSQNADGRLEIFARGSEGAVWHNWQTAPNNGWSGWYSLGGWIDILELWP